MEWVAISVHIAGDCVTHQIADRCRVRIPEAAGLLSLTFAGMALHAQDGNLANVTSSQIEQWAYWSGRRGLYAVVFRDLMCDEDGLVTAWEKYNGAAIREAKASAQRVKKWRDQRKADRHKTEADADGERRNDPRNERGSVRRNVRGNETITNGSTVPNSTRPDHTVPVLPKNQEPTDNDKAPSGKKPPLDASHPRYRWMTPIAECYEAEMGAGTFPYGQAARYLSPLAKAGSTEQVLAAHLRTYLALRGDEFGHLKDDPTRIGTTGWAPNFKTFAMTFAKWSPTANDCAVRAA